MARILLTVFIGVFVLNPVFVFSQNYEDQYVEAEDLIEDGNYHKALDIFQSLLEVYPNNANLNFKVGFCYLSTATEKVKSIPYLEYASNNIVDNYNTRNLHEQGAPLETLFYLGKAYHVNYRFDDAERIFFELKEKLTSEDISFINRIDYELAACQAARVLMKSPVEMKVSNLGKRVNSTYSEHSPVISGDESILIFTSKRKQNTGENLMDDGQYFEDIYISSFNGKSYTQAQKISKNINTIGHEASIGLSFDGSKLFIYRDDEGDGNIYVSNRKGAEWMVPEKLSANINTRFRETHASISFDQNQIFFTSDRKGGYGGLDIYRVRKLPNGNWSRALNLGPEINTEYDEEGPYLHPDGVTLFFASMGHNSMGGFDIFISYANENDKWSTPQNIGYPINTPDDNIYYVPSVDGRRAYYSSYTNNSIGNYDIFRIDLAESHVRNQTVIAGYAVSPTGEVLEEAIITLTDADDEIIGIYTPDPETAKFLFILPRGARFNALFESSNFEEFEYTINVPELAYDQTKQVVIFNEIANAIVADEELVYDFNIDDDESEDIDTEEVVKDIVADKTPVKKQELQKPMKKELTPENLLVSSELNMTENHQETEENNYESVNSTNEEEKEAEGSKLSDNVASIKKKGAKKVKSEKSLSKDKTQSIYILYYLGGAFLLFLLGFIFIRIRKKNK